MKDNGVLEQPESGSDFGVWITESWGGGWYYDDRIWVNYLDQERRASWVSASNYYSDVLHRPQAVFSFGDGTSEYDNSTGTVTMLFSRLLSCPGNADYNAFQMRDGERWVMGFLLQLKFNTNGLAPQDYADGWPRNIYPYLSNNSSWWPKLVIDLTNLPAIIPGQTAPENETYS